MSSFPQLANLYWRIVLLQAKPQDVPASSVAFTSAVTAALVFNWVALVPRFGPATAIAVVVLDLVFLVVVLRGALRLIGKTERFVQSYSALCGSNAWLALLSFPLLYAAESAGGVENASSMLVILLLMLHVWSVMVIGHVLRHSFEVSFLLGVAVAIAYVFVITVFADALLPLDRVATSGELSSS